MKTMMAVNQPGDIKPCPFCKNDKLFYVARGALCCDTCQAEGPFVGDHFDQLEPGSPQFDDLYQRAKALWNARSERQFHRAEFEVE